jgi:hypothetical protein
MRAHAAAYKTEPVYYAACNSSGAVVNASLIKETAVNKFYVVTE